MEGAGGDSVPGNGKSVLGRRKAEWAAEAYGRAVDAASRGRNRANAINGIRPRFGSRDGFKKRAPNQYSYTD